MERHHEPEHVEVPAHVLRREGSHLYGLVITGAVLATVNPDFRLIRVAFVLLTTLAIYWAAETFVHWTTARTLLKRDLTKAERRSVMADGWPLVAASGIPLLILAIEAVFRIETPIALQVALALNVLLLMGIGYQMGKAGGLRGASLLLSAALTGGLGLAMILLKSTLH